MISGNFSLKVIAVILGLMVVGLASYILMDDNDDVEVRGHNRIEITGPEPNGNSSDFNGSGYINVTYTRTNSSSCFRQQILLDGEILDDWNIIQDRVRPESPFRYNTIFLTNDQHWIEIICYWDNNDYSSDSCVFYVDNS
jgi:hypothetical protein